MEKLIVTVLLPVYNAEPFLREAIDSVLAQTFGDFELLLINDGSTDRSRDVVKSFADPRIRLVENPRNLGLVATLNRGLELARGKYVARMDADDVCLPERFRKQVDFLERHPSVAVVGSWYETIEPKPRVFRHPESPDEVRQELLLTGSIMAHPTVMMRRAALESLGMRYDQDFAHAEDYDLWARLSERVELANLQEVLLRYRCHPNQTGRREGVVQELNSVRVKARLLAALLPEPRQGTERRLVQILRFRRVERLELKEAAQLFNALLSANRRRGAYPPRRFAAMLRWLWNRTVLNSAASKKDLVVNYFRFKAGRLPTRFAARKIVEMGRAYVGRRLKRPGRAS